MFKFPKNDKETRGDRIMLYALVFLIVCTVVGVTLAMIGIIG